VTTSPTTYEVAFWLEFELAEDQKLVDWAIGLLQNGCDAPSAAMLAGAVLPYSHFELINWSKYILRELKLDYQDRQMIIDNYIRYTVIDTLSGKRTYLDGLKNMYDLYLNLDRNDNFSDFYQLYNAKSDLEFSPQQWYWQGATRDNIDEICYNFFLDWFKKHPEYA